MFKELMPLLAQRVLVLTLSLQATENHKPVSHHESVTALIETLGSHHIGVVQDEYAVSQMP